MAFSVTSFVLVLVVTYFVYGIDAIAYSNVGLAHPDHIKHLKGILKLHQGGFTNGPIDIPKEFRNHPGQITTKTPVCRCDYATSSCHFFPTTALTFIANVDNTTRIIVGGTVTINGNLNIVNIVSPELSGTKCLFFSTYSNSDDIDFAVSFLHGRDETTTPVSGNQNSVKRISIGVGTKKPYRIAFRVYAFGKNKHFQATGRPDSGVGIIGKIVVVDGPCDGDRKSLDCEFDYGMCHWALHDKKYIWYPLPFGLHHTIKHKIEWGALAAFAGEGNMWSPVVRSVTARCFSFLYAKGATDESFLRVWLLYRIPTRGNQRVLLYEDVSFDKVIKKLVQVNLFVQFSFQIAFEGRSKTILHGVIILRTSISSNRCKGIGLFSDVNQVQIAPTPPTGRGSSFKPTFSIG